MVYGPCEVTIHGERLMSPNPCRMSRFFQRIHDSCHLLDVEGDGNMGMPWYWFPISNLVLSCWTLSMIPYNDSVRTQGLVPLWLETYRLEPCKAERIHRIGNSLRYFISPHYILISGTTGSAKGKEKAVWFPYSLCLFWIWRSFRCGVLLRSLFDLVLSILFWTSCMYYAIV